MSQPLRLTDRVVLVTRAGHGQGRSLAMALSRRGARVAVHDEGWRGETAGTTVTQILEAGGQAASVGGSLDPAGGAESVVAASIAAFDSLEAVVHVAGVPEAGVPRREQASGYRGSTLQEELEPSSIDPLLETFAVFGAAWHKLRDVRGDPRLVVVWPLARPPGGGDRGDDGGIEALWSDRGIAAAMGAAGLINGLKLEGTDRGLGVNMVIPVEPASADAAPTTAATVDALTTFLIHPSCAETGRILWVDGARVTRTLVGVTPGFFDAELTVDEVAARAHDVAASEDLAAFFQAGEEMPLIKRHLTPQGAT